MEDPRDESISLLILRVSSDRIVSRSVVSQYRALGTLKENKFGKHKKFFNVKIKKNKLINLSYSHNVHLSPKDSIALGLIVVRRVVHWNSKAVRRFPLMKIKF